MKTTFGRLRHARHFLDEPGAEKVEHLFQNAAEADLPMLISAVNWAEVLYKLERKHGKDGLATARHFELTMPGSCAGGSRNSRSRRAFEK